VIVWAEIVINRSTTPRYADWKAPDEDGEFLIWPVADEVLRRTGENQRRLSSATALIQGVPLGELRRVQRKWLGHGEDGQALVASGHQTELYHPGVWAKDVLVNEVARRTGGAAWHLAVDTDTPRHLNLRWPGVSLPITDDSGLAVAPWTELLGSPTPGHVGELERALNAAKSGWDFQPMAGEFLGAMKRLAIEQPPLCSALTNAIHQLNWGLGLRHHALLVSPAWHSPAYLVLVHHVLARAEEFAAKYNAALAGYRREEGITTPGRPMPDLHVEDDRVEAAFWLDDLGRQTRRRLMLERVGDAYRFGGGEFTFDPSAEGFGAAERLLAFLRGRGLRITPRALTLTLFFRMLVADQFVHGIGGARYDRVTDRIIESFFGIEPPSFCVTTATLYFPAARGQRRVNLGQLLEEGRRLRHGWADGWKRDMAGRIAVLPRASRERAALFGEMHAMLAREAEGGRTIEWKARVEEATRELARQKGVFDRELFFAIQPRERLTELVERYAGEFARV
jgi:hypothetical protein